MTDTNDDLDRLTTLLLNPTLLTSEAEREAAAGAEARPDSRTGREKDSGGCDAAGCC